DCGLGGGTGSCGAAALGRLARVRAGCSRPRGRDVTGKRAAIAARLIRLSSLARLSAGRERGAAVLRPSRVDRRYERHDDEQRDRADDERGVAASYLAQISADRGLDLGIAAGRTFHVFLSLETPPRGPRSSFVPRDRITCRTK